MSSPRLHASAAKPETVRRTDLETTAAELRRLFDAAFAAPLHVGGEAPTDLLAIRVAGERFALRLSEISGLIARRGRVMPVPSKVEELVGLTGIRAIVVPVFSLGALLGFPRPGDEDPRWLALCGPRQSPIALAFDIFEGHRQVAPAELYPSAEGNAVRYVSQIIRDESHFRGIISVPPIVDRIMARGRPALATTDRGGMNKP